VIEHDRVAHVLHDLGVRADLVRDVGIGEQLALEQGAQPLGMVAARQLDELREVDDLVVTPVPDGRPRVVRLRHLPIDAFVRDAVRVVAIRGRGVHELDDDALDEIWVRHAQRFPVLEDVAPIALKAE
jgi:hypothetical protein